jgi:hypothetical protein
MCKNDIVMFECGHQQILSPMTALYLAAGTVLQGAPYPYIQNVTLAEVEFACGVEGGVMGRNDRISDENRRIACRLF